MRKLLNKIINSNNKNNSVSPALQALTNSDGTLSSPADLIALLRPMKRILCICPVPIPALDDEKDKSDGSIVQQAININNMDMGGGGGGGEYEYERYSIGMAISDPYLSYAIPIHDKNDICNSSSTTLLIPKGYGRTIKHQNPHPQIYSNGTGHSHSHSPVIMWKNLPRTAEEFLQQMVGYTDVGALVLGLPLKRRDLTLPTGFDVDDEKMIHVRRTMQCIVRNFRTTCDDGRGLDSNSSADTATGTKTDIGTTTLTSIGSGSSSENDSKSNAGGKNDMCDVEEAATSMIMEPKAGPLDLQCYVGDHLTLAEARKFALEEPEMWEGIDLDGNGFGTGTGTSSASGDDRGDMDDAIGSNGSTSASATSSGGDESLIPPSVHAATALNAFLWRHTGGWRNTFA